MAFSRMGRSIRSKIGKRLRTVKRQRVDAMILRPKTEEHHQALKRVIEGRSVRLNSPKNAFKYPNAEGAVFAQHTIVKPIDFRSSHLPMAGYTFRGGRRKYEGEQADYMDNLAKTSHPKMAVLGGGGAILAKTGERISKYQAEVLATAAERPEVAAMAESGQARASDAVAEAMAEEGPSDAAPADMPVPDSDEERPGRADSDHLRLPIVKNTTRATRDRPRSNAVKKKTKVAAPKSAATSASPGKQKKKQKDVKMQGD